MPFTKVIGYNLIVFLLAIAALFTFVTITQDTAYAATLCSLFPAAYHILHMYSRQLAFY